MFNIFLHFLLLSPAHSSILSAAFLIREMHFALESVFTEKPGKEINKLLAEILSESQNQYYLLYQ